MNTNATVCSGTLCKDHLSTVTTVRKDHLSTVTTVCKDHLSTETIVCKDHLSTETTGPYMYVQMCIRESSNTKNANTHKPPSEQG